MANQNTIAIELIVKDNGSVVVKQFGDESAKSLKGVEQGASRTASAMDGLKKSWTDLAVAGAAAWMLVSQAMEYVEKGAKAQQAEQSFRDVATAAGESADTIIEAMKRAAAGTVDDSDIMQKAVKGMMLGFSGDQMIKIMEAARVAARMTGEDVVVAYEKITDAISTNMPRALKQYGLITKEQISIVNKALAAGVEDVNLYDLAMANAALRTAQMGKAMGNAAEDVQIFKKNISELKEGFGSLLINAFNVIIASTHSLASGMQYAYGSMLKLKELQASLFGDKEKAAKAREDAAFAFKLAADLEDRAVKALMATDAGYVAAAAAAKAVGTAAAAAAKDVVKAEEDKIKGLTKTAEAEKAAAEKKKQATEQAVEAIRKANVEIEGIGKDQYDKDIARITSEAQKMREARVDEITVANFVAAETTAAKMKAAEETKKIQAESTKDYLIALEKETEEHGKELNKQYFAEKAASEKIKEILAGEYEFAATENERAINKIIADATKKVKEIEKLVAEEGGDAKAGAEAIIAINENKTRAILEKETENTRTIAKLNYDLIKDIRGWEEPAYRARILEIQAEGQAALDKGAKWESVSAKMEQDTKAAYREMALATGSFFDGMGIGFDDMKTKAKSAADYGLEVFTTFATSSKTAISDIFFQSIKTGTADLSTIWQSFSDSMLKSFTDAIGDMVTKWIIKKGELIATAIADDIVMMFKADWTSDSSSVLKIVSGAMNLWNSVFGPEELGGGYARGGVIPGTARVSGDSYANDRVHVLASPGEYFMPRTAVTPETLPVLEYMRENKGLPRYAEGGPVDPGAAYLRRYTDVAADPYFATNPWAHWEKYGQYENRTWGDEVSEILYRGKFPMLWYASGQKEAGIYDTAVGLAQGSRGGHRRMKFPYDKADNDGDLQDLIKTWAEAFLYSQDGFSDPQSFDLQTLWINGFEDADIIGRLKKPDISKMTRSFYLDDTYEDTFPTSQGMSWIGEFLGTISKIVSQVIVAVASAYVAVQTGGAGGAAIAAFMATTASMVNTRGDWQSSVIAGIIAAAMVGISEFFATPDTSKVIDYAELGEGPGNWQSSPHFEEALWSNVGQGSTPVWLENIIDSATKFVAKNAAKWAIKVGAGGLGRDGSNSGHATFNYDSTDDQGVFDALAPLMAGIAPKSTALNLSFAGGGGFPAYNGLDYVPRDGFPILAHQGEAVLTKRNADEWRGGSARAGVVINGPLVHIEGNLIADENVFNEFVEKIDYRLSKLAQWVH